MKPDVTTVLHAATGEPYELDQILESAEADALRCLVRDLVDRLQPGTEPGSGPEWICAEAARQAAHMFGVAPEALRTKDRHRPVSDARAIAQCVARENELTLTAIAAYFGQDHTSVMHSIKKVAASPRLQVASRRISTQISSAFTEEAAS